MYFAADDGKNTNHRIYVLANASADPMKGSWDLKGKVSTVPDKWAIDASVFEHNNILYMTWSGWEGDHDGQQNIYIAKMKNPWTVDGERVKISEPFYTWEKYGDIKKTDTSFQVFVNEGPQILRHGKQLFIIYSASGCWTEKYSLGMLSASADSDLLKAGSWKKYSEPVFTHSEENKVYAPGHNSFFKSPDGTEDWILYHANRERGQGCGRHRSPRAQKFTWRKDGTPDFGEPVATGVSIAKPSEKKSKEKRHH